MGRVVTLLDKLDGRNARDWYSAAAVQYGWSRNVLASMIMNKSMERTGTTPSNLTRRLPSSDSDLGPQTAKDPHAFEFLCLSVKSPSATSSRH